MLGNLPDIQFVETDVNAILTEMIESFEDTYYQNTGKAKKLYPGDPIRIFIYTQALRELQLREVINNSAKQNLLAYAEGANLDHFAARHGIERFDEAFALMTVRFHLSTEIPTLIPGGTRITVNGVYFETVDDSFIRLGQVSADVVVICQVPGTVGNEVPLGVELAIVDPLPFVISVVSAEKSTGGTDRESDEELRERVYSTYESLSVAGPELAYISMVKNYSNAVLDAAARQSGPGIVEITVLLDGGGQPNEAFLSELEAYLSDGTRRPLTDKVIVKSPAQVTYDIQATYYLTMSNAGRSEEVNSAVNNAVQEFVGWQKGKLGRDVNPSELIFRMRQAGAKRIVLSSPDFATVQRGQVAVSRNVEVVFGGFEDE